MGKKRARLEVVCHHQFGDIRRCRVGALLPYLKLYGASRRSYGAHCRAIRLHSAQGLGFRAFRHCGAHLHQQIGLLSFELGYLALFGVCEVSLLCLHRFRDGSEPCVDLGYSFIILFHEWKKLKMVDNL